MGTGLLLHLAIGDALGFCYEMAPLDFVQRHNKVKSYVGHPLREHVPGSYSDDTQLSVALAELLLSDAPLTHQAWADKVVEVYKRDPRPGYAKGFQALLNEVSTGSELLSRLTPHSRKNGGAMRAPVCALVSKNPDDVADLAAFQASLTHATTEGIEGAVATALLVHLCREGTPREDLGGYMEAMLPGHAWRDPWKGPVDTWATNAPWAALSAITLRNNLRDILWQSISYSGDVDTVASLALAAASQHPDIIKNLPKFLFDKLENGPYGRDYIMGLDGKLISTLGGQPPSDKISTIKVECKPHDEDPAQSDFIDLLMGAPDDTSGYATPVPQD